MASNIIEDKDEFAKRYLTPPRTQRPYTPPSSNPFAKLEHADRLDEATLTRTFIELVKQCDMFSSSLILTHCGIRPDPAVSDESRTPDVALFRPEVVPPSGNPHWFDQLVAVMITSPSVVNTSGVSGGRGYKDGSDILAHVELLTAVQQRFAVFTLLVVQRTCYFARWDHSGMIITEPIDYFLEWRYVSDVFWRISQCPDYQLGVDITVLRLYPHDPEYQRMTEASRSLESDIDHTEEFDPDEARQEPYVFAHVRSAFAESLDPLWPRYILEVPGGRDGQLFLVAKPRFRSKGYFGRGTRGYVALEYSTGRFVWLKDAWRARHVSIEREGDILKRLNDANIRYVPTLVCHGDIGGQTTFASQRWEEQQARTESERGDLVGRKRSRHGSNEPEDRPLCPLRYHMHYRLVVKEVALPLSEFQFGRQLISVVNDCVFAHSEAYDKLSLLHCDVSTGNVLIYPKINKLEGGFMMCITGLLADWEMARSPSEVPAERFGTLTYMSVARLSFMKDVEVPDELESFFNVLLYHAVRYLRSTGSDMSIATFVNEFFEQFTVVDGRYACPTKKLLAISTGLLELTDAVPLQFDSHMDGVLRTLLSWFKARHAVSQHGFCQEEEPSQTSHAHSDPAPHMSSLNVEFGFPPPFATPPREHVERCDGPAEFDRELASMVSSHYDMVRLLSDAEWLPGWTDGDKVGDRIPASWCPDMRYDSDTADVSASRSANKRLRTG